MDELEKQIRQIRAIRALRVRARMREQLASVQEVRLVEQAITFAEGKVNHEEVQAITFQRDGLAKLVSGTLVNIESLKQFNHEKLKSIKTIADAKTEVAGLKNARSGALEHLEVCESATKQAQKRLLGIEEVVEKDLWK